MTQRITSAVCLTLVMTLALGVAVHAQVKKDDKTGLDRLNGTIQSIKDKTLTITQSGTAKGTFKVTYNDQTKITQRNADAKASSLKEGQRVIVLGKMEKDVIVAARIDIRTE